MFLCLSAIQNSLTWVREMYLTGLLKSRSGKRDGRRVKERKKEKKVAQMQEQCLARLAFGASLRYGAGQPGYGAQKKGIGLNEKSE